jgi:hypothetical protein
LTNLISSLNKFFHIFKIFKELKFLETFQFHPYKKGIRARVCAVYEPPQQASDRHVKFGLGLSLGGHDGGGGEEDGDWDPNGAAVDRLLGWLGMHRVGWLFTDLWPADPRAGTVHCIRNEVFRFYNQKNYYFLDSSTHFYFIYIFFQLYIVFFQIKIFMV